MQITKNKTIFFNIKDEVLWKENSEMHHLSWLSLVTDQFYVVQCNAE